MHPSYSASARPGPDMSRPGLPVPQWLTLSPRTRVDAGYPELGPGIRSGLARRSKRLMRDRVRGRIRFESDPGARRALHPEIMAAYLARCEDAGWDPDVPWLESLLTEADEIATLRFGGELAAWLLAVASGTVAYRVLAAEMVPGFRRYQPARFLETALLARVMTEPHPPSHPGLLRRKGCQQPAKRYRYVDWGLTADPGTLVVPA